MPRATTRLYGVLSLLLLAGYALGFGSGGDPFPLGADGGAGGPLARAAALALGLVLGWGIPGVSLALLADARVGRARLLGRALGLGVGYILATGLACAAASGHAPGRGLLLALLALPPAALALRPQRDAPAGTWRPLAAALCAVVLLAAVLWPKLHREGMNGDGTEAYELARSLDAHPLPHWDLERWEGPGRFGTPAVNPFLANSFLAHAQMTLLGRGELAARLPLLPALVVAAAVAAGLGGGRGASAWAYVVSVSGLYLLWSAVYAGYEPAFSDLAEPAATDTLMLALWLAGFGEIVAGAAAAGVAFLLLASAVLYSAPLLATLALAALAAHAHGKGRPLRLWLVCAALALSAALVAGWRLGDVADWLRQVRSEYWHDFSDQSRRMPTGPLLAQALLLTGGLPLAALAGWRRLSAPGRALLLSGGSYLALVLASSSKNLHYLAPLPFLLAPAALEASGPRLRLASAALVAAVFALSWPSSFFVHRETVELGRISCVEGLDYERASLAGDVVYTAFERPGRGGRLAVGKHTFVRYALDLGGRDCQFRLAESPREGFVPVAGAQVRLFVRDPDSYARWRFATPPVPRSWLFPRRAAPESPAEAGLWKGPIRLGAAATEALRIEGMAPLEGSEAAVRVEGEPGRLLLPVSSPALLLRARAGGAPAAGSAVRCGLRVNGREAPAPEIREQWTEIALDTARPPWRRGWNVVELAPPPGTALELDSIAPAPGAARP